MTAAGWLLMISSCGGVTALLIFCYRRLLAAPPSVDEPTD